MPTAQMDFHLSIDRAAGLLTDATWAVRTASLGPLPPAHRHILTRALGRLERAQDDLFTARNDPWSQQTPQKPQLQLPL